MSYEMLVAIEKHWPVYVFLPAVALVIVVLAVVTRVWDARTERAAARQRRVAFQPDQAAARPARAAFAPPVPRTSPTGERRQQAGFA